MTDWTVSEFEKEYPEFFPVGTPEEKKTDYISKINASRRLEHAQKVQEFKKLDAAVERKANPVPEEKPYDYNDMATELRNKYSILSFNKTLFRYQDGIYIEDNGFIDSVIVNELLKRGISIDGRVTTAAQQVKHYITFGKVENEYPFNLSVDSIPARNGIVKINFETGNACLIPFGPEHRFNYKLNVVYDPAAPADAIKKYLDSLGVDTQLLTQVPAHAILGMTGRVYKKAYFLRGDKNSGKSTYVNLIVNHLFGITVCSSVSLQALMYDRFRLAELDGRIVNAYADLSDQKLPDIGRFKLLTGGDLCTVERKHRDPYQIRNRALFLFSGNKYPKIDVPDDAFWARWIALEFEKIFDIDPVFEEKTFTEANVSGFFNLVLTRMQEIIKSGGINVTDSVEQRWLNDSSSCHQFINHQLERCKDAILIKSDAYREYTEYCAKEECVVDSQRALTEALKMRGAATDRQFTINGDKGIRCYQGFAYKWSVESGKVLYSDEVLKANAPSTDAQKKLEGEV